MNKKTNTLNFYNLSQKLSISAYNRIVSLWILLFLIDPNIIKGEIEIIDINKKTKKEKFGGIIIIDDFYGPPPVRKKK